MDSLDLPDRYRIAVRAYITRYRRVTDPDSADDYEQETFAWALANAALDGLTDDDAEARLLRIARQRMRVASRRRQTLKRGNGRVMPLDGLEVAAVGDPVEAAAAKKEVLAIVAARLGELSSDQQEVFRAYILDGLTVSEIAAKRGTSKASASTLLKRATVNVRSWFVRYAEDR